jgi:AcrR family transcriptional regulator
MDPLQRMSANRDLKPKAVGRPRDEAIGGVILNSARQLVIRHGYDAVTTRMIAEASGAGKQTIYRRWPSKAELVLAAFLAHAEAEVDQPHRRAGSVRTQVRHFLQRTFEALAVSGPALRALMATAQGDEAFRTAFVARFIAPRRRALEALLHRALGDRGRLNADVETAVMMLYGALWYRLLLHEPLDAAYADRLATLVAKALAR